MKLEDDNDDKCDDKGDVIKIRIKMVIMTIVMMIVILMMMMMTTMMIITILMIDW